MVGDVEEEEVEEEDVEEEYNKKLSLIYVRVFHYRLCNCTV